MAAITTRATLATALTTALDQTFTNRGKKMRKIWPSILEEKKLTRGQFRDYDHANFGLMVQKGDGETLTYDELTWGNVFQHNCSEWALGFRITRAAADDMIEGGGYDVELKIADMASITEAFSDSALATREDQAAQLYLLANSTTVTPKWLGPGRDGVALAGTHTLLRAGAGSFANNMTAAALNYYQLLSARTVLVTAKTDEGFYSVPPDGLDLIVGPYNESRALELIKTTKGKPDTNENTYSAMNETTWNLIVDPYLGPTFKGWAVRDRNRSRLYFLNRKDPEFKSEGDFETVGGMKYSVYKRDGVTFASPFGLVYNAGA